MPLLSAGSGHEKDLTRDQPIVKESLRSARPDGDEGDFIRPITRVLMRRAVVLASVVIGLLSACSNGEPDVAAETPSQTPTGAQAAPAPSEEPAPVTTADVLRSEERFSRFRDVLERTKSGARSILEILDDPAGVTLFVPIDAAFDALDPTVVAVIEDPAVDNDLLYGLFGHHYVHSPYPSERFRPGDQLTWRRSDSGPVQLSLSPLTWGGHRIIQTDIRTANGFIHVIDGVVIPDDLAHAATTGAG